MALPLPSLAEETYPNIDITGYKKYEYQQINVSPANNYFLGLQNLGAGYGYSSGPWQERLQLSIVGRLSERLSVAYDLEQQPEFPERYHVEVNYDNHKLLFGDFTGSFTGNEFASTSKSLNGVLLTSHDDWYDMTLVPSAKLRSYTQPLTSQRGNNTVGPYSLGHTSIIEGSEYVELNGKELSRDNDYTIDYFEGKITFKRILSSADEFKYSYEYSNIIDIFFPATSKRDFFGLRTKFTVDPTMIGRPEPKPEKIILKESEAFPGNGIVRETVTAEVLQLPIVTAVSATDEAMEAGVVLVNGKVSLILHDTGVGISAYDRARIIAERINLVVQTEMVSNDAIVSDVPKDLFQLRSNEADYICTVKGRTIFTVDKKEAEIWGIPPKELSESWVGLLNDRVRPRSMVESEEMPVDVNSLPAEVEEEETGTYALKHRPIVMFSETILFEGIKLEKDVDYKIDYDLGTVRLLVPKMPTSQNKMTISYKYYEVAEESEILPGINSRGPYVLAHDSIVAGSEKITISEVPYVRDLDYKIDYVDGKVVFFGKILSTQNINVRYRYVSKKLPPKPELEGPEQKLSIGTTYLKESARKGEGAPTAPGREVLSGSEIINLGNTIYLRNFPIDPASVIITLNGSELAEGVDYAIPSTEVVAGQVITTPDARIGFRVAEQSYEIRYINDAADTTDGAGSGTIKMLKALSPSDSIVVSFTYYERLYDTRNFEMAIGSQQQYNFDGTDTAPIRGMVPGQEVLLKLVGNVMVRLSPNTSEASKLGDYSINYGADSFPYITFNDPIDEAANYILRFNYVLKTGNEGKNISHDILGVDVNYSMGDMLNIETAIAKSQTDKAYGSVATSETRFGDGGKLYQLGSTGIVDDSEKVFINNVARTRDLDYSISYSSGLLSFYTAVSTADSIRVDYSYEDPSVGALMKKEGYAYKFGASGKIGDNLTLGGDVKKVEVDFSPMGGLPLALGSDSQAMNFSYKPGTNTTLRGDYKHTNDLISQLYTDKFVRHEDWNLSSDIRSLMDTLDLTLGFRQSTALNDKVMESPDLHLNDSRTDSWTASVNPRPVRFGDLKYTNNNDLSRTLSYTDILEEISPTTTTVDYFRTKHAFDYSNWAGFSVNYQFNEPIKTVTSLEGTSTEEIVSEHTISKDITYTTNVELTGFTGGTIRRLNAMASLNTFDQDDLVNETLRAVRNQSINVNFDPVKEISTTYRNDRSETPSVYIENLGNPGYERTYMNVRYTPMAGLSTYWNGNWDEATQDNGSRSRGTANTYTVEWMPVLPGELIGIPIPSDRLQLRTKASRNQRWSSSSPYLATRTLTEGRTNTGDVSLTYYPDPQLTLSSQYILEMYYNNIMPGTQTDTLNTTYKVGATYRPDPRVDLSANYNRKDTMDRLENVTLPKQVIDAHVTYRFLSYASITYDFEHEGNRGEVLSGSINEMDLTKVTNGVTFSMTVPQNNVVLNNIVFNAGWKQVDYKDKMSPMNDFTANKLTFDGTLNF